MKKVPIENIKEYIRSISTDSLDEEPVGGVDNPMEKFLQSNNMEVLHDYAGDKTSAIFKDSEGIGVYHTSDDNGDSDGNAWIRRADDEDIRPEDLEDINYFTELQKKAHNTMTKDMQRKAFLEGYLQKEDK